jgi:hypothetical protein
MCVRPVSKLIGSSRATGESIGQIEFRRYIHELRGAEAHDELAQNSWHLHQFWNYSISARERMVVGGPGVLQVPGMTPMFARV